MHMDHHLHAMKYSILRFNLAKSLLNFATLLANNFFLSIIYAESLSVLFKTPVYLLPVAIYSNTYYRVTNRSCMEISV